RMTAQGENSAAGSADISQQQLQNRGRSNDLHSFGVLRPANCVANRSGPLGAGCSSQTMRDFVKKVGLDAADFLHHLRRVPGEMPFQFLKNTLRVLQCEIALRSA